MEANIRRLPGDPDARIFELELEHNGQITHIRVEEIAPGAYLLPEGALAINGLDVDLVTTTEGHVRLFKAEELTDLDADSIEVGDVDAVTVEVAG